MSLLTVDGAELASEATDSALLNQPFFIGILIFSAGTRSKRTFSPLAS